MTPFTRRRALGSPTMLGLTALFVFAPALAGRCAAAQAAGPTLPVVASFSILADFVRQVGGERVAVTSIVGPGGDAHVHAPTPADARAAAQARLIVENGLGYEGWMARLATGPDGRRVIASAGVQPRADRDDHAAGRAHRHAVDPHAWQSPVNAKTYVANIRDGLIAADPEGRPVYEARARAYLAELDALDADIRARVAALPPERRRIVTTHDAFGYFADRYGLSMGAPGGVSTESDISARDVAALVRTLKADKAAAVFLENVSDQRLIEQIARESGARVGGVLYSDSLTAPEGPAGTYIAMMRHNILELTKALGD